MLRVWIEQGAIYEPHWAYVPPRRVTPPLVEGVTQPIDRFIRGRLAADGVQPSPTADRSTLIRRVTLDLTGLPPSSLEVDAFVNDPRPEAYERVVDRLLGSEHFGERWARWWLDLAHYGDSDGYLQDFLRPVAWRYRQWVVDAFNSDMPFDQFSVEQLAGELIPNATVSQRIGTGFLRNTLSNREGGADLEEYRVNQVLDRTMTLGTTWLGLTIGCARSVTITSSMRSRSASFTSCMRSSIMQMKRTFTRHFPASGNRGKPRSRSTGINKGVRNRIRQN